jgi:thioesterase domain-containing protein
VEAANHRAQEAYRLRPLKCDAVLFRARQTFPHHPMRYDGWKTVIMGELQMRAIPCRHRQLFDEPFVRTLARGLTECLEQRVAPRLSARNDTTSDPSRPLRATLR